MMKPQRRANAERQFSAAGKPPQAKQPDDREKERRRKAALMEQLRGLRLAKEGVDREAAEAAAAAAAELKASKAKAPRKRQVVAAAPEPLPEPAGVSAIPTEPVEG